jgi:outer membrane biosynthesis protein TonB
MVFVSLGIHLVVFLLFAGVLMPRFQREARPVYHVDLVNLPVKDPQAGRPDARPEAPKPKPEPKKPEPIQAAQPEPAPKKPEPVKVPPPKPEPRKPEAPKVVKKPAEKAPPVKKEPVAKPEPAPGQGYDDALSAIDRIKRQREMEELKRKLDQLASRDTRQVAAIPNAPAGMPDGKGTEAGPSYDAWLHEYLKQAWTLSRYQVSRRDLEAVVTLVFDSRGNLIDYRFVEESEEERFNNSVRRAILQLKKLPTEPGERMEKEIVFNLKELLE